MKTLAFVLGLCIGSVGGIGFLEPSVLAWIAHRFVASGSLGFYVIAAVRIALGLLLVAVASSTRVPRVVRVLGFVIVILGATTALTGLVAAEPSRGAIEGWVGQGPTVIRLTALVLVGLGGFLAWACAPTRGAA